MKHSSYSSNTLVKNFLVRILAALAGFPLALNSLNRYNLGLDSNFWSIFEKICCKSRSRTLEYLWKFSSQLTESLHGQTTLLGQYAGKFSLISEKSFINFQRSDSKFKVFYVEFVLPIRGSLGILRQTMAQIEMKIFPGGRESEIL